MAGIECALVNKDGRTVAYLGETSALTLALKNASGGDVSLTGGPPVGEADAGNGSTLVYLYLSDLVTDPASVSVSCPGWTVQKQDTDHGVVWCLALDANDVLKKDASLSITLSNVAVSGKPGPRSITVDAYAFFEDGWAQQPPVMVQYDPGELRPLSIDFSVNGDNVIYITEDADRPLTGSLIFRLTNPSPTTPLVPDDVSWGNKTPTFTLTFVYATTGSGAGALTSAERASHFASRALSEVGDTVQGDNRWSITLNTQASPFWTLIPNQLTNKQVLGTGAAANFEFLLDNIITQLAPGTTLAYLQWTGLPGYQDGYRTVALTKAKPVPGILRFMTLSPADIPQGTPVMLNWQTFALSKQTLSWSQDRKIYTFDVPASQGSYAPDPQPDDSVVYTLDGWDVNGVKVPNRQQTVTVIANAPSIQCFKVAPVVAPFEGQNPNVSITGTWTALNAVTASLNGQVGASPKTIALNTPGDVILSVDGRQGMKQTATATVYGVPGYICNFVSTSAVSCGEGGPLLRNELTFKPGLIPNAGTGTWTFAMEDALAGRRVVASQDFTWTASGTTVTLQFTEGGSAILSCTYGALTLTGRQGNADAHGLLPLALGVGTSPGQTAPVFTAVIAAGVRPSIE